MNKERALSRAMALCSRREYAISEINKKMDAWHIEEEDAKEIISALKELDFLNEERFAAAFAKDKFRFSGWGGIKISYMLRAKNISKEAISKALLLIDDSELEEKLSYILESKYRSLKGDEPQNIKRAKCIKFAMGRGFDYNQIVPLLNKID